MRCHDVLGIYVYDPIEKIDVAYQKKIESLNSSELTDEYKSKKSKELETAYRDCINYYSRSFGEKCKLEFADMGKAAFEPQRLNSCGMECSNCLLNAIVNAIYIAICGVILGVIIGIIGRASAKKSAEAAAEKRRNEEESSKRRTEQLNKVIAQKTTQTNSCIGKRGTLNAELVHRQELLRQQQREYETSKNIIVSFCRNIGLSMTEAEVINSPAVTALKKDLQEAEEAVNRANRAINENEKLIVSGQQEAQNARNELRR